MAVTGGLECAEARLLGAMGKGVRLPDAARAAHAFAASGIGDLVELPLMPRPNEVHAWHLYPIRLHLDRVKVTRAETIDRLADAGSGTSVQDINILLKQFRELVKMMKAMSPGKPPPPFGRR